MYCKSRKRTKEISELLTNAWIFLLHYYHAGLTQEERKRKQEAGSIIKLRVIVCTNAFGMGIDKPDVRAVVHADVPDCLENYYQEAGRAGRDGKKAYAVLLYDEKDLTGIREICISNVFLRREDIRKVYQCSWQIICRLPAGTGEGNIMILISPTSLENLSLTVIRALFVESTRTGRMACF